MIKNFIMIFYLKKEEPITTLKDGMNHNGTSLQ